MVVLGVIIALTVTESQVYDGSWFAEAGSAFPALDTMGMVLGIGGPDEGEERVVVDDGRMTYWMMSEWGRWRRS